MNSSTEPSAPTLILAADHRARGVVTIENYRRYLEVLRAVMPLCDGILASVQPLRDLTSSGSLAPEKKTYLSLNRTGLAGSAFELDDRLVASVGAASEAGFSGVKHMVRIDMSDELTARALELLGRVLEEARAAGLEAMVEPLCWREGRIARDTGSIVLAAVIAHDMGAPLLKLPLPDAPAGEARVDAAARVVQSVGVPVLFLGGPRGRGDAGGTGATKQSELHESDARREDPESRVRQEMLDMARDAMAGGAAGMAVGRALIEDPAPLEIASLLSAELRAKR